MKTLNLDSRTSRALSQFEMILVMAVMGVISAVAVPLYSNLTESSKLTVLKSNLHHANSSLRAAYRAGPVATNIDLTGEGMTVESICTNLTTGGGVFVDSDGDGVLDPHEIGFEMDLPPNQDPYEYLIGQYLFGNYSVNLHGDAPVQLAIFDNDSLYEVP